MLLVMLFILILPFLSIAEKLYVVERERGSLAVVEEGKVVKEIEGLGNLSHATVKVWEGYAYVISRDGYLSKIDPKEDKLLKRVKVGNSTIGLDFTDNHIVVANYDPHTVVVLDEELNILKTLKTGSRNVGIKGFEGGFVFSLMDKDEVWVVERQEIRKFKVGNMPFDALLSGDIYLLGFFKESGIGMIDIKNKLYRKLDFKAQGKEVVFKIPHFGTWGIVGDEAFIPAVGEKRLYKVDLRKMEILGHVELGGLPVFASVSPNGNYLAANFSGDREDYLALVDVKEMKVLKELKLGQRIMHLRFSQDGTRLYVSSYFDSKLRAFQVPDLKLLYELNIPHPSGVFLIRRNHHG